MRWFYQVYEEVGDNDTADRVVTEGEIEAKDRRAAEQRARKLCQGEQTFNVWKIPFSED